MTIGDIKNVNVTNIEKSVTYASGWSNQESSELKTATSTTPNSPTYYQEFVFVGKKDKEEVKSFVENWFNERNIVMADWEKTIHVKHINQCQDGNDKRIEIWSEFNFNGTTNLWVNDVDVTIGNHVVSEGFSNYTYILFEYIRWLGSPSTTGVYVEFLHSDYKAQNRIVE